MKPGRTSECVQERLVQKHRLHGVHLKVTYIHLKHLCEKVRRKSFSFEHLKALEEIEEGSQLLRENLERDELKLSHTFRQRFSSIKRAILIPILPEINRSSTNVPYIATQCFT